MRWRPRWRRWCAASATSRPRWWRAPWGPDMVASLARLLPVTVWARRYRAEDLRCDVLAGVTLAAFALPESLAYATLAGLPAQVGLYGAIAAMATYAVFGSARLL